MTSLCDLCWDDAEHVDDLGTLCDGCWRHMDARRDWTEENHRQEAALIAAHVVQEERARETGEW